MNSEAYKFKYRITTKEERAKEAEEDKGKTEKYSDEDDIDIEKELKNGLQCYSMDDWPADLRQRIGIMNDSRRRYEFPPENGEDFDAFLETFKIMPSQGEIEKYMTLLKERGFIAQNMKTAV